MRQPELGTADNGFGPLVIVSGLPAAGKSTLADRLGHDLGRPVVRRDRLRHYVFDSFWQIDQVRDLLPAAADRHLDTTDLSALDAAYPDLVEWIEATVG